MNKKSKQFLKTLLHTPSPSGYEHEIRKVWMQEMKEYADEVRIDVHGNVIASLTTSKSPKIMLSGHMDELGFQVRYIDKNGFIFFNQLGGFDIGLIPGRKVRIHTKNDEILGVTGKKAVHLLKKDERRKAVKPENLYIDIGAKDKEEAEKLVEIGDSITYDPNFEELRNNIYTSRAFDDKIGSFIVAEVMKNIHKQKKDFNASLFSVSSCQEEVGVRGAQTSAYGIDPDIGIAIDVTNCSDTPDASEKRVGEIKLNAGGTINRGPNINPKVFEILKEVAEENDIDYQVEASSRPTGTDANVIQITRSGVAAGLLGIPCRYMHSYTEVISLKDTQAVIDILTKFCLYVDKNIDFTP